MANYNHEKKDLWEACGVDEMNEQDAKELMKIFLTSETTSMRIEKYEKFILSDESMRRKLLILFDRLFCDSYIQFINEENGNIEG